MWVRVDDHLHTHPKVRAAWSAYPASVGLHLLALSYSGDQLTDGRVDAPFINQWLPNRRHRDQATSALVAAALWEPNGKGWVIHDFLDFNRSRDEVLSGRKRDRNRRSHDA